MKRYGQRCPVARTLDVVGDRWSLLIVRELLLGPKRYSDLADGLPGIGTNVLAGRLSDLQAAGVIARRTLPPPTPVAVYELTEAGERLRPVLAELRRWGASYAPAAQPEDAARPGWLLQSAASLSDAPIREGVVVELHVDCDVFELIGGPGSVTVKARPATTAPTATIRLDGLTFFRLASNQLTPEQAAAASEIDGDHRDALELFGMLGGCAS